MILRKQGKYKAKQWENKKNYNIIKNNDPPQDIAQKLHSILSNNIHTPNQTHNSKNICLVWLFFLSPVWIGVCRTGPADCLTPCGTLSRRSMHQTLPWLPCFRFSKGIIIIQLFGISATDIPCRGAAHTFPSSITIPCSICNLPVSIFRHADKCLFAQLIAPHHPKTDVLNVLCPLRYFYF